MLATLAALMVGTVTLAGVALAEGGGAPTVVRHFPLSGGLLLDDQNVKATFSEPMKARSINTNTFYLESGSLDIGRVPATVRYNAETRTAILDPSVQLRPDDYLMAVVEGAGDGDMKAVKDKGGTPMARDYYWQFPYWTAYP
jgi:hypothetical protein